MNKLDALTRQVMEGGAVSSQEALELYHQPLEELCQRADAIRRHFCGNRFDLCAIVNGKSGRCSEDCRFCAQSACNHTGAAEYPLLSPQKLTEQAKKQEAQGVLRYSIVTSGRRLSEAEVDALCQAIRQIKRETGIYVCVSVGLLDISQFRKLKEAGAERAHNNLETSRRNFPNICTTHTFDEKAEAIRAAQEAGL